MSLTICYTTSRKTPMFRWFVDSLKNQLQSRDGLSIIVVDFHAREGRHEEKLLLSDLGVDWTWTACKPCVWQGDYKLTKDEWWAKSAYLNTAICLCETDWIAFVDDRSVLLPGWLDSVKEAMAGNYAVCGAYEKRHNMTVENGVIRHGGTITGVDPRTRGDARAAKAPGQWWFGCNNAMPLEWALRINGYDESCDSLGMEDVLFGQMMELSGFPIKYDGRMKIVEDRTPDQSESFVKRTDKGISPNDKSHALLKRVAGKKEATHHWNFRELRKWGLRDVNFPIPTEPTTDWYDGKPLSEFP